MTQPSKTTLALIVTLLPMVLACSQSRPEDVTGSVTSALDGGSPVVLNEVKWNPAGADDGFEYIEIKGTGTIPPNTYILSVEGDAPSAGRINFFKSIGGLAFGASGLLLIQASNAPYGAPSGTTVLLDPDLDKAYLQNGSESLLLVQMASAGVVPGLTMYKDLVAVTHLDSVAFKTSAASTIYGTVELTWAQTTNAPDAFVRFANDDTARSANAWYFGDLTGSSGSHGFAAQVSPNFPFGATLSPGLPNDSWTTSTDAGSDAPMDTSDSGEIDLDAGRGRDADVADDATPSDGGAQEAPLVDASRDDAPTPSDTAGLGSATTPSGSGCTTSLSSTTPRAAPTGLLAALLFLVRRRRRD